MAAKLKKGDRVVVIAGKDAGVKGEIVKVFRKNRRAVVTNVNQMIRHVAQTPNRQGGREPFDAPIDLSNLMLIDPERNVPTRVGFRFEDGRKVRFAKKSGATIDG